MNDETLLDIYDKIEKLHYTCSDSKNCLEEIQKELSEWRYSKSSPIQYHQEAIVEKLESLEYIIKDHFKNVNSNDSVVYQSFEDLENELRNIKIELERPKKLIPILLTAILIVLLIK